MNKQFKDNKALQNNAWDSDTGWLLAKSIEKFLFRSKL